MGGEPFITRRLSPWLDLIRAAAAFAVLLGHAFQAGLYAGHNPFSIALQQNAVIVFFVLSGLVIASSAARPGHGAAAYAAARIARIVPVALAGLAFSLATALLLGSAAPASPWEGVAHAAVFLNESYRTGLPINPPYWSLAYEAWYYVLFGAGLYLHGWRRAGALALAALLAGPNVLLLWPCWLLGVALAHRGARAALSSGTAWVCVSAAVAGLFAIHHAAPRLSRWLIAVVPWPLGHSHYTLTYSLLAVAVALGLLGLRRLVAEGGGDWIARFGTPIRFAADMSFSLYLVHWPLLMVVRAVMGTRGAPLPVFVLELLAICAASAVFSLLVEQRRHALRRWLEAALTRRPLVAA